jgi:uncharacterized membrane protein YdjX (TVP38/TMEM64 family)
MRTPRLAYAALAALILLSGLSFVCDAPVIFFERVLGENKVLGAIAFVLIMFATTVVAPLTSLPLVPLISPVLGPFLTGVLSILGWSAGAVVAFLIARHAGRPLLSTFVSLEAIDRYERLIPREARFMTIFALRMVIPVDILSYALGILSSVSLLEYTLATVLGISWFAFAFAYLGEAAFEGNVVLFLCIGAASLVVLGLSSWYVVQKVLKNK